MSASPTLRASFPPGAGFEVLLEPKVRALLSKAIWPGYFLNTTLAPMSHGFVYMRRAAYKSCARPFTPSKLSRIFLSRFLNTASNTDTMTEGSHNAWVGAKGPGAWDLRSKMPLSPFTRCVPLTD